MRSDYDIYSGYDAGFIPARECACGEAHLVAKDRPRRRSLHIYDDGLHRDSLVRVVSLLSDEVVAVERIRPLGSDRPVGLVSIASLRPVGRSDLRTVRRHIRAAEAADRAGDWQHEDHHRGMALRMCGLCHS